MHRLTLYDATAIYNGPAEGPDLLDRASEVLDASAGGHEGEAEQPRLLAGLQQR